MDDLTYLLLEKGILWDCFNIPTFKAVMSNDADFFGYSEEDVVNKFGELVKQNSLQPQKGASFTHDYYLTDKGRNAYNQEKKRRQDKIAVEELQKAVSNSVLNVNSSVMSTNESVQQTNVSVQQTNVSVQEINRVSSANFKVQNRIAFSSMLLAGVAILVTLIPYLQGAFGHADNDKLKQLQETNTKLEGQIGTLTRMLDRQLRMDSALIKIIHDSSGRR